MTIIDETGRSAEEAAADAAEAIRSLNHVTFMPSSVEFPSDVYRILGELYTMTQRLPQALQQLASRLDEHRATGRLTLDSAHRHTDPNLAVGSAIAELSTAAEALETVTQSLTAAQNDIANVAMTDDV